MSTAEAQIEEIKALIERRYNPETNGSGYWDGGNFDDTFEMGRDVGGNETLLSIGRMLGMDLPDVEEMEF